MHKFGIMADAIDTALRFADEQGDIKMTEITLNLIGFPPLAKLNCMIVSRALKG